MATFLIGQPGPHFKPAASAGTDGARSRVRSPMSVHLRGNVPASEEALAANPTLAQHCLDLRVRRTRARVSRPQGASAWPMAWVCAASGHGRRTATCLPGLRCDAADPTHPHIKQLSAFRRRPRGGGMTQLSNGARKIVAPWSSRAAFVVCGVRDAWNWSGVYLEGVEQGGASR